MLLCFFAVSGPTISIEGFKGLEGSEDNKTAVVGKIYNLTCEVQPSYWPRGSEITYEWQYKRQSMTCTEEEKMLSGLKFAVPDQEEVIECTVCLLLGSAELERVTTKCFVSISGKNMCVYTQQNTTLFSVMLDIGNYWWKLILLYTHLQKYPFMRKKLVY